VFGSVSRQILGIIHSWHQEDTATTKQVKDEGRCMGENSKSYKEIEPLEYAVYNDL
jgi:hypothetical protein